MFTNRPPHGYSPKLLSELGTAEALEAGQTLVTALELRGLLISIREHETLRPRITMVPASVGSDLLH